MLAMRMPLVVSLSDEMALTNTAQSVSIEPNGLWCCHGSSIINHANTWETLYKIYGGMADVNVHCPIVLFKSVLIEPISPSNRLMISCLLVQEGIPTERRKSEQEKSKREVAMVLEPTTK